MGLVGTDVMIIDVMGVEGDAPDTNDPSEGADVPDYIGFLYKEVAPEII